jgi:hypothetical protein
MRVLHREAPLTLTRIMNEGRKLNLGAGMLVMELV